MIGESHFWITIVSLSIGTLLIRSSMILLSSRITISSRVKEVFTFIPVAVIPALLMPMVFFHKGEISAIYGKERLLILLLSTLICYLTKSMVFTILFGLSSLYFLTLFLTNA